ncbi:dTDP-glucose 4,6-dehydratase [soil metagenome]
MRVLVTGSSGFVGAHTVGVLARRGHEVIGVDLDHPVAGDRPAQFIECDVTDEAALTGIILRHRPDSIVHAAAITPGEDDASEQSTIMLVNQVSTLTVLLAAARSGCRRFVFLSSAAVYADPEPGVLLTEGSAVRENGGVYAQSKLGSERFCAGALRSLGVPATVLRIGPVYGEFERPTASRGRMSPILQAIELADHSDPTICNSRLSVYNWIHGDDVGLAIQAVIEAGVPGPLYNLAGSPATVEETFAALRQLIPGMHVEWTDLVGRANVPVSTISRPISSDLIRSELSFSQTVDLHHGLARVLKFRDKRRDG